MTPAPAPAADSCRCSCLPCLVLCLCVWVREFRLGKPCESLSIDQAIAVVRVMHAAVGHTRRRLRTQPAARPTSISIDRIQSTPTPTRRSIESMVRSHARRGARPRFVGLLPRRRHRSIIRASRSPQQRPCCCCSFGQRSDGGSLLVRPSPPRVSPQNRVRALSASQNLWPSIEAWESIRSKASCHAHIPIRGCRPWWGSPRREHTPELPLKSAHAHASIDRAAGACASTHGRV